MEGTTQLTNGQTSSHTSRPRSREAPPLTLAPTLDNHLGASRFPGPTHQYHNDLSLIVSLHQNFDSLGFPIDHPGRSSTDTYYVNKDTVLHKQTSARQADTFRSGTSDIFLISADVYKHDVIDRYHYPVFHKMEGARIWSGEEYKARGGGHCCNQGGGRSAGILSKIRIPLSMRRGTDGAYARRAAGSWCTVEALSGTCYCGGVEKVILT